MKAIKYLLGVCAVALLTVACNEATAPVTPPTPGGGGSDTTFVGSGTKADPYTVGDVISMNPQSTTAPTKTNVWMEGYIVGVYDNDANPAVLDTEAPFANNVNIMLCETATGGTLKNTVCIQLPAGAIRDSLNLQTHESYVGLQVKVYGDVYKYNTLPGIKNTSGFWWVKSDTGVNPPESGNFDVPEMTFAELKALYSGSGTVTVSEDKKIVGVVVTSLAGGNSTSLKNLVITNSDNSEGISVRFSDKDNAYEMNQGVEILVSGATLSMYAGSLQLGVAQLRTQGIGTMEVVPNVLTVSQLISDYDTYEFTVVQTEGTISASSVSGDKWGSNSAHVTHYLVNGTDSVDLFISKYASFISSTIPTGGRKMLKGLRKKTPLPGYYCLNKPSH